MTRREDDVGRVATLLAYALLDGPWSAEAMAARARHDLAGLDREPLSELVRELVQELVTAHPHPPLDAPRALAAQVGAWLRAREHTAWPEQLPEIRPRGVVLPASQRMVRRPFDVPVLDGAGDVAELLGIDLAHLEWFADVRGLQLRARPGSLHHYRSRWLARRGAPRLLEAPRPRLRAIQRALLRQVLDAVPADPVAHGFVRGRSALTGAARHTGADVVVRVDLVAFFAHVPAGRVHGCFRTLGYPEAVAHLLTGLCTHRTPVRVRSAMPPGGEPEDRYALRDALRRAHLPQGAPTSPALANLACRRLDRRLAGLASSLDATVTRYADDITISGGPELAAGADRLVRVLGRIATEEGYAVNHAKTSIRGRGARQVVTGVVVNERTNVPRPDYDRLRATLHNAVRYGPDSQNRTGHPDFRAHLEGRIGWVAAVHPGRAARLRAEFDRISWS